MMRRLYWALPAGALLLAVFWSLNWSLEGYRTHVLFFPLWLGYVLFVDGLIYWRRGSSLIGRSRWRVAWLFVISIPLWWLFEAINLRTNNWAYVGSREIGPLAYAFWASLNFSTVVPAVFVTAELVDSFGKPRSGARSESAMRPLPAPQGFALAGAAMLAAVLIVPDYAYPLVWLSLFFIVDPINARGGRSSLLQQMINGRWRVAVALALGALVCGFFWELWNYYSDPRWVYRIPFLGFGKVFEMPVLGYGGYIPFSWELYAFYQLVRSRLPAPDLLWDRLSAEGTAP